MVGDRVGAWVFSSPYYETTTGLRIGFGTQVLWGPWKGLDPIDSPAWVFNDIHRAVREKWYAL